MRAIALLLMVAFGFVYSVISMARAEASDSLSPAQAMAKIQAGVTLIDVRTAEEYATGHIEGAENIPYEEMSKRISELGADKAKEIVLYCRSGRRSGIALGVLKSQGFSAAFNGGGLADLQSAGAKVIR